MTTNEVTKHDWASMGSSVKSTRGVTLSNVMACGEENVRREMQGGWYESRALETLP